MRNVIQHWFVAISNPNNDSLRRGFIGVLLGLCISIGLC